jgi:hypothetical protein
VILLTKIVNTNSHRIVSGILRGIDIGVMISGAVIRPAQIGMKQTIGKLKPGVIPTGPKKFNPNVFYDNI